MKGKALWSVLSCVLGVSVLLVSCAQTTPATTTRTTPTQTTRATATTTPTSTPMPTASTEKPRYGGIITLLMDRDVTSWDPTGGYPQPLYYLNGMWHEHLMQVDWARGPAGSRDNSLAEGFSPLDDMTGTIAESWEIPEIGTWVMKIRQGIRWQTVPGREASNLMNGREVTVDDIIWNVRRSLTEPKSFTVIAVPNLAKTATIEKTGPWEVTIRTPGEMMTGWTFLTWGGGVFAIVAKEVVQRYGDLNDWRNIVGTGPFMVEDYVAGSSLTLARNPNYWRRNPVGPGKGDQIPYVDKIKFLPILDPATRLAAVRTGKADWIDGLKWEDANSLMKSTPTLQKVNLVSLTVPLVGMRQDKKDLPYSDVRVRRALTMATDLKLIQDSLHGGQADLIGWPVSSLFRRVYRPIEQMPASIQELYTYDPDKAKRLLAEAGYPNGFKARMVVLNSPSDVDQAQILQQMWRKVGVELALDIHDSSTFTTIRGRKSHDEMILNATGITYGWYAAGLTWRGPIETNTSYVNDPPGTIPEIEDAYQEIQQNMFIDMVKVDTILREKIVPPLMEGAYYIQLPKPYLFTLWQPWLKNYHGEIGSTGDRFSTFTPFVWLDQDVKSKALGK